MTFLEGHFVTPTIIGRRLSLNALAVFMALAFWTWLWGPMGAFLSSPLLIVGLILKEHLLPEIRRSCRRIDRLATGTSRRRNVFPRESQYPGALMSMTNGEAG